MSRIRIITRSSLLSAAKNSLSHFALPALALGFGGGLAQAVTVPLNWHLYDSNLSSNTTYELQAGSPGTATRSAYVDGSTAEIDKVNNVSIIGVAGPSGEPLSYLEATSTTARLDFEGSGTNDNFAITNTIIHYTPSGNRDAYAFFEFHKSGGTGGSATSPYHLTLDNVIVENFRVGDYQGSPTMIIGYGQKNWVEVNGANGAIFQNNSSHQSSGYTLGSGSALSVGRPDSSSMGVITFAGKIQFIDNYIIGSGAGGMVIFHDSEATFNGGAVFEGNYKDTLNTTRKGAGAIQIGGGSAFNASNADAKPSRLTFGAGTENVFRNNYMTTGTGAGAIFVITTSDTNRAGQLIFGANASLLFEGNHSMDATSAGAIHVEAGLFEVGTAIVTFTGNYASQSTTATASGASASASGAGAILLPTGSSISFGNNAFFTGNYSESFATRTDGTSAASTTAATSLAGAIQLGRAQDVVFSGALASFIENYSKARVDYTSTATTTGAISATSGAGAIATTNDATSVANGTKLTFSGSLDIERNYSIAEVETTATATGTKTATSGAGVFSVGNYASIQLTGNSNVIGNYSKASVVTANTGAGAISAISGAGVFALGQYSKLEIDGSANFIGNYSEATITRNGTTVAGTSRAGVVEMSAGSTLTLLGDIVFSQNYSAQGSGGVVAVSGANARIVFGESSDISFYRNSAGISGGAISNRTENASLEFTQARSVVFQGNYVDRDSLATVIALGGTISVETASSAIKFNSDFTIINSFVKNSTPGAVLGGAVFVGSAGQTGNSTTINFEALGVASTGFINNFTWAVGGGDGAGGAIAMLANFSSGGLLADRQAYIPLRISINGATLLNNYAVSSGSGTGYGGAVFMNTKTHSEGNLIIGTNANLAVTTEFRGNMSGSTTDTGTPGPDGQPMGKGLGGAIYDQTGMITIRGNAIFQGNRQNVLFTEETRYFDEFTGAQAPGPGAGIVAIQVPIPVPGSGVSNAIYFATSNAQVTVDTDGLVEFYDAIDIVDNLDWKLAIDKRGSGTLVFYDEELMHLANLTVTTGFVRLASSITDPAHIEFGTVKVTSASSNQVGTLIGQGGLAGNARAELFIKDSNNGIALENYGRVFVSAVDINGARNSDPKNSIFIIENASASPSGTVNPAANWTGGLGGDGTLSFRNTGSTASLPINTVNGNVIHIDVGFYDPLRDADATWNDADAKFWLESTITGAGRIEKIGKGTFYVDRQNTYTGGTTITDGTIRLEVQGPTAPGLSSFGLGTGPLIINRTATTHGTLYIQPNGTSGHSNFQINNALSSTTTLNGLGGTLRVDLNETGLAGLGRDVTPGVAVTPATGNLTFTYATNAFPGTLWLENTFFKIESGTVAATTPGRMDAATLRLGGGSMLSVGSGITPTGNFIFDGGIARFNNIAVGVSGTQHYITTTNLDISGTGFVQVDKDDASFYNNIFVPVANDTPLLLRDDYGLLRRLIAASGTVTGDASQMRLRDFLGNPIFEQATSSLIQGGTGQFYSTGTDVANQYLVLTETSLHSGYSEANKGLSLGAILYRLDLRDGLTTVFQDVPYADATIATAQQRQDFKGIITGSGNLEIRATSAAGRVILDPRINSSALPDLNANNSYTGTTTIHTGILETARTNAIASSSQLIIKDGATFDAGTFVADNTNPLYRENTGQILNKLTSETTATSASADTGSVIVPVNQTATLFNPSGAGGDSVFGGLLTGSGTYAKDGPGKLTLSHYNGTGVGNTPDAYWQINGGTLEVTGVLGTATTFPVSSGSQNAHSYNKAAVIDGGSGTVIIPSISITGGTLNFSAPGAHQILGADVVIRGTGVGGAHGTVGITGARTFAVNGRIENVAVAVGTPGTSGTSQYTTLAGNGYISHPTFAPGYLTPVMLTPEQWDDRLDGGAQIAPGNNVEKGTVGQLTFGTTGNNVSFDGVTFTLDLSGNGLNYGGTAYDTSFNDFIQLLGSGSFGNNAQNELKLNLLTPWSDSGSYVIMAAAQGFGQIGTTGLDDAILNMFNVTGNLTGFDPTKKTAYLEIIEGPVPGSQQLVLFTTVSRDILYWDGGKTQNYAVNADVWKDSTGANPMENIWRRSTKLNKPGMDTSFENGAAVVFSEFLVSGDQADEVQVPGDVKTYSLVVNDGSFQFTGNGKIYIGYDDQYHYKDPLAVAPDTGNSEKYWWLQGMVAPRLEVTHGATVVFDNEIELGNWTAPRDTVGVANEGVLIYGDATFNNKVTAGKMDIHSTDGSPLVATVTVNNNGSTMTGELLIPAINLGHLADAGHVPPLGDTRGKLLFNTIGNGNSTAYNGVISGNGSVEKSGTGTHTFSLAQEYNAGTAKDSFSGHYQGGETHVSGGTLVAERGLGKNGTALDYRGSITIDTGATLSLRNTGGDTAAATQVLAGVINGALLRGGGGQLIRDIHYNPIPNPAGDGTLRLESRRFEISNNRNTFNGTLEIGTDAEVKVTGTLGSFTETFDGNTPMVATYWLTNYQGAIQLTASTSSIEFAYTGDYQLLTGNLVGVAGSRVILNSGQHLYAAGNASNFSGHTTVTSGAFHLPAGQYGTIGTTGVFTVAGGASLHGGAGSRLHVNQLTMASGSWLSALPGGFRIIVADANNVQLADNLSFILDSHNAVPVYTGATAVDKSAVSFAQATGGNGTIFAGAGGVVLPVSVVNLNVGILGEVPRSGEKLEFVLMEGLDIVRIQSIVSASIPEEAITSIFGSKETLTIMGATFRLSFQSNKLLLTQETYSTTIPEPSTYAMIGGLGVLGLAVFRRRRKKKIAEARKR